MQRPPKLTPRQETKIRQGLEKYGIHYIGPSKFQLTWATESGTLTPEHSEIVRILTGGENPCQSGES